MKVGVQLARIIVGLLFVISGLVKANDPLGLSYKMQEFFEVWSGDLETSHFFLKAPLLSLFSFLHNYSLTLSITMITFEIVTGIALLIGWKPKRVVQLLLVLILFFTFLTGYAYASGKFKNCGCFGDCLPITPLTSFVKDLVLLGLILFLVIYQRCITPVFQNVVRSSLLIASILLTLLFQWYVLNYLPVVDCLPFKKGNNIAEQMKIPANAITDSFAIRFIYKKSGKQCEFSPTNLPPDLGTYTFVDRKDKLVRKGNAEPAIKGFSLISLNNEDSTEAILNLPLYNILYFTNFEKWGTNEWEGKNKLSTFLNTAIGKGVSVHAVTTSGDALQNQFMKIGWSYPIFNCDGTVFRKAARTNPCIYLIKKGTVINRWSLKQLDNALAQLNKLPAQEKALQTGTTIHN